MHRSVQPPGVGDRVRSWRARTAAVVQCDWKADSSSCTVWVSRTERGESQSRDGALVAGMHSESDGLVTRVATARPR
eukprot:5647881-Prymnesium_polylepis.2